jgi:hypothetical protein
MVGNFPPTLLALKIGVPHEELQKKGGVELILDGVERS